MLPRTRDVRPRWTRPKSVEMSEIKAQASATAEGPATARPLLWARLASLVSVLPLGVWTVNHLWDNLAAFQGPEAWQRAVTEHPHPIAHAGTLVIVFAPLLLHTVWGIQRLREGRPNLVRYDTFANLRYVLQRIAAGGVLFFIGAHVWLAMLRPRLLEGRAEPFEAISREMHHHGPTLVVYLLGTLGVAYHLANGLSSFAWQWGLVGSRGGLRRFDVFTWTTFAVLLFMSWAAIYALWKAGAAL